MSLLLSDPLRETVDCPNSAWLGVLSWTYSMASFFFNLFWEMLIFLKYDYFMRGTWFNGMIFLINSSFISEEWIFININANVSFESNFRIFDQMQSIFMVTVFCHRLFQSHYCFTLCTDKSFGNFFIACAYHLYFDKISKNCILNELIYIWILTVVGFDSVRDEI